MSVPRPAEYGPGVTAKWSDAGTLRSPGSGACLHCCSCVLCTPCSQCCVREIGASSLVRHACIAGASAQRDRAGRGPSRLPLDHTRATLPLLAALTFRQLEQRRRGFDGLPIDLGLAGKFCSSCLPCARGKQNVRHKQCRYLKEQCTAPLRAVCRLVSTCCPCQHHDHGNFVFHGNYAAYTPANVPRSCS